MPIPLKDGNIKHVKKTMNNLNAGEYKLQKTPKNKMILLVGQLARL